MAIALIVAGVFLLLVAWVFFWMNLNTPIQTRIPIFAGPIGLALIFFALGRAFA
jgi:hypothetical protein